MLEKLAHASIGLGVASIGVSIVTWAAKKGKTEAEKAHAERFGNFIGHWPPTFFLLGVYLLKLKEMGYEREAEKLQQEVNDLKEKFSS